MYHETSIAPLIERFDAFIVDLWGVVHDGQARYPGVVRTLEALQKADKRVVFLSNAPRRASVAQALLAQLGIEASLYDGLLTSGEVTYRWLLAHQASWKHCLYLGPERERSVIDDLPHITAVTQTSAADFCLMSGFSSHHSTLDEHRTALDAALEKNLPLLCPNPDLSVVRQTGETWLCAGAGAQYYAQQGGEVHYIGKPYEAVYDAVFELLGTAPKSHVCAIGDGLHTDIKGANDYHLFSVLIAGGLLRQEIMENSRLDLNKARKICQKEGIMPNAVMESFCL